MDQTNGFLKRIESLPWKGISYVSATSFVLASAISIAIAWKFMPTGTSAGKAVIPPAAKSYAKLGRTETLDQSGTSVILKRNIFNSEGKLGDADPAATEEIDEVLSDKAVETTLPIKVVGIIYAGNPYNGLATIQNTQKRRVNSFVVGDTILESAKLKEILPTRIIIDRNGRIEYAELEEFKLTRNKRRKKRRIRKGPAAIATGPPPETYTEDGFKREGTKIEVTEGFKDRMLQEDFTKTLQDAKATPFKNENGEIQGFKLTRIREDSVYQKAGFQNEDIVEEINGVQLNSVGGAISLLQRLRAEKNVEVRVRRGGKVLTFSLSIN